MKFIVKFTEANRSQMSGVWKELFNKYTNLRNWATGHMDNMDRKWYSVKLNEFVYLNVVYHLYDKLNSPNSLSLVKNLFDDLNYNKNFNALSISDLLIEKCLDFSPNREYERNMIFGGVYYVFSRMDMLYEPTLLDKIKEIVYYNGNTSTHYFDFFSTSNIIKQNEHTLNQIHNVKEYSYLEETKKSETIEQYKRWVENSLQQDYIPDYGKQELRLIYDTLNKCQKGLLLNGVKPLVTEKPLNTTSDDIKKFIKENFYTIYASTFVQDQVDLEGKVAEESHYIFPFIKKEALDKHRELYNLCQTSGKPADIIDKILEFYNEKCIDVYACNKKQAYNNLKEVGLKNSESNFYKVLTNHKAGHLFQGDLRPQKTKYNSNNSNNSNKQF